MEIDQKTVPEIPGEDDNSEKEADQGDDSMSEMSEEDEDSHNALVQSINPDAFSCIAEHLNIDDLMTLSHMNDQFRHSIHYNIIHQKKIQFYGFIRKDFFEMFGDRLKQFKFIGDQSVLCDLLKNIIEHCPEDRFRRIEFDLDSWDPYYDDDDDSESSLMNLIKRAKPHFRNVETILLRGDDDEDPDVGSGILKMIRNLFDESHKLHKLRIENLNTENTNLFDWDKMKNLHELHLDHVTGIKSKRIRKFFRQKPQIKRFVSFPPHEYEEIGKAIAENCHKEMHSIEAIYAENNISFDFPTKFQHLKQFTLYSFLGSGNDLDYSLAVLSHQNTVKKLIIHQHITASDANDNRKPVEIVYNFTALETIEISTNTTCTRCDSADFCEQNRLKFLINNSTRFLQNVQTIILSRYTPYLSQLIRNVPNVRRLSIWKSHIIEIDRIMDDVKAIMDQRKNNGNVNKESIEIIANRTQWKLFDCYEDIEKIICLEMKDEY